MLALMAAVQADLSDLPLAIPERSPRIHGNRLFKLSLVVSPGTGQRTTTALETHDICPVDPDWMSS